MSNYLDVYVRDSLKRVPGVADVIIFGERKFSMRLWLDPVRMAGRGLTAPDVVSALSEQNVEVAAGQVGQQPAVPGQQYQVSVRAVGRLSEPVQFDNIILKTNADGTLVRLKDVGHAELGAESYAADLQFQAFSDFDASDALPNVRAPTLVLTGDIDELVPPGNSKIIAELIPGAELHDDHPAYNTHTSARV